MKKCFSALLVLIFISHLPGQTPAKILPVNLSEGEEVLQVAANKENCAVLTVHGKNTPDFKKYYVLIGGLRKGPYKEVVGLQAAFDTTGFIYAAHKDTAWFVYEGNNTYGPFSSVAKVRSGNKNYRCMYLARKKDMRQVLYNRNKTMGGQEILSDCIDFELSADGSAYCHFANGLAADTIVYKNNKVLFMAGAVRKMKISDDGYDVAFLFNRSIMDLLSKSDSEKFSGLIQYMSPGSFGMHTFKDTLDYYIQPGDVDFYRVNYEPGYYCSFQDKDGNWKLFHNRQDMNVKERDIMNIKAMPDGSVVYAAKPAEPGPGNLDVSQYYVYISQQAANGPYLEIKQMVPSGNGSFLAIEGRQDAGWFLVLPSGGLGPFDDIRPAKFLGDAVVEFKALYQGEWTSLMMTGQGMTVGSIVRKSGIAKGIAIYSEGDVAIYLL